MIKDVVLWANGMVMVFDENKKQLSEYQGKRTEVLQKLTNADLSEAGFSMGVWNNYMKPVSKDIFFLACALP